MSFSVSRQHGQFEYAGGDPHQLLAQPSNMFKPRFLRMVLDMLRFNRRAPEILDSTSTQTLGAYLAAQGL